MLKYCLKDLLTVLVSSGIDCTTLISQKSHFFETAAHRQGMLTSNQAFYYLLFYAQ